MSMKFFILFMGMSVLILTDVNAARLKCYQPNKSTPVGTKTYGGLVGADVGAWCNKTYPDYCMDPTLDPHHACTSSPNNTMPRRSR